MPIPKEVHPKTMSIGDTVVITGGNPRYVGLKATLLDLYRLPASARKGYYDYGGELEIIDPPYTGTKIRLIQGNFRTSSRITPKYLQFKKEVATKQRSERLKKHRAQYKEDRELERIFRAYPQEIKELIDLRKNLTAFSTAAEVRQAEAMLERLAPNPETRSRLRLEVDMLGYKKLSTL